MALSVCQRSADHNVTNCGDEDDEVDQEQWKAKPGPPSAARDTKSLNAHRTAIARKIHASP